ACNLAPQPTLMPIPLLLAPTVRFCYSHDRCDRSCPETVVKCFDIGEQIGPEHLTARINQTLNFPCLYRAPKRFPSMRILL
ncbi:MAG: hypothetical protein JXN60_04035, partial [Lentisphaerae bacterium]|nr:hypothetical protein [Lentisphaerota bacterium]